MDLERSARRSPTRRSPSASSTTGICRSSAPSRSRTLIRRRCSTSQPERLIVSSDCGFGREGMTRRIAFYKMVAIVRGTNIVRRELGLEEAACRAADPTFAFGRRAQERRAQDLFHEQVADVLVARDRVRKRKVGVDRVVVAAPVALARDVAGVGELGDDPMRGPLGDTDALADVAQANSGVTGDADQHLGVVGQKRPTRCRVLSHPHEHNISRLRFHAMVVIYSREDRRSPRATRRGGPRCSPTHAARRSTPPHRM